MLVLKACGFRIFKTATQKVSFISSMTLKAATDRSVVKVFECLCVQIRGSSQAGSFAVTS